MLYLGSSSGAQFDERARQLHESDDVLSAIESATFQFTKSRRETASEQLTGQLSPFTLRLALLNFGREVYEVPLKMAG